MSVFDRFRRKQLAAPTSFEKRDLREIGQSGQAAWSTAIFGDYNPDMQGARAIENFDKMRRSDAQVRGALRLVKAPVISADWYVQPASDSDRDKQIAEFVEWNLANMSRTFRQVLWEALLMLDFGWYAFEKVWEVAEWRPKDSTSGPARTVVKWKKLAPRHPINLDGWIYDANGGIQGMKYVNSLEGREQIVEIPNDKLLRFVFDEEGGNPEGISLLRSAYPHWVYKHGLYKIDAIQKERHGIGIPDITLPPSFNANDKKLAQEMARNMRTNEKAYIIKPPGWEVGFAELKGQPVDALASATHHDLLIARNMLVQFMNIVGAERGASASSESQSSIFFKALRYVADIVAGVINQYGIPQLVNLNFSVAHYPTLMVRRLGEDAEWRAAAVAMRNLVEAQIITPTPETEKYMRGEMGLPWADTGTARSTQDRLERLRPKPSEKPTPSPGAAGASPGGQAATGNRVPKPTDG